MRPRKFAFEINGPLDRAQWVEINLEGAWFVTF